jgi:uncharacterized repeat protein (TIGR01451 family)
MALRPLFLALAVSSLVFCSAQAEWQAVGHAALDVETSATVGPGATLRYDVYGYTLDQLAAPGTVTLHLPASVTYARTDGVAPCQWTRPSGSGGDVVCATTLTPNTSLSYSIYATVPPSAAPGDVLNATVTYDFGEKLTEPLTTRIVASTDLRVTAVASSTPKAGVEYPLTIRLTNTGNATAYAPTIDVKPTSLAVDTSMYWPSSSRCIRLNPRSLECTAPDIAPGASVEIGIQPLPNSASSSDSVHIDATITNAEPATTANDSIDFVTALDTTPVPSLTLTVPPSAQTGVDYAVKASLQTDGPAARNLTLTYDTPPQTVFRSVSADGVTCTTPAVDAPGRITCSTPLLTCLSRPAVLPAASVAITVRSDAAGPLTHTVTVNASNIAAAVTAAKTVTLAAPDVRISAAIAATPQRVLTGGNVELTLSATNAGRDGSGPLTISAAVPSNLQVYDVQGNLSPCAAAPQIQCSLSSLAGGSTATLRILAHASNTPGSATVTGSVTSGTQSLAQAATTVQIAAPIAPLTVTLTADRTVVTTDNRIAYTLNVTNGGPDEAVAVTADIQTSGDTGVISVVSGGFVLSSPQRSLIHATAASLDPGKTITMKITLASPSTAGKMSVNATVVSATGAPQTATISTPVIAPGLADVTVQTPDATRAVELRQPFTLQFTVTNAGSSDAAAVSFDATLSSGLVLTSMTTTRGTCAATHCTLGTLTSGASAEITIAAAPMQAGNAFIRGAASTAAQQSSPDNDAQQVPITVVAPRTRAVHH